MLGIVRRAAFWVVAVGSVAVVAACGGSGDDGAMDMEHGGAAGDRTMAAETRVTVRIVDALFDPDEITISSGQLIELTLENKDGQEHDFQVDGLEVEVMSGGASSEEHGGGDGNTLALHTPADNTGSIVFMAMDPGTYEFYCTIAGHKDAGMVGTLTVE